MPVTRRFQQLEGIRSQPESLPGDIDGLIDCDVCLWDSSALTFGVKPITIGNTGSAITGPYSRLENEIVQDIASASMHCRCQCADARSNLMNLRAFSRAIKAERELILTVFLWTVISNLRQLRPLNLVAPSSHIGTRRRGRPIANRIMLSWKFGFSVTQSAAFPLSARVRGTTILTIAVPRSQH